MSEDSEDRAPSVARFDELVRDRVHADAPETDLLLLQASMGLVRVASRLTADYESAVHRHLGLSWAGYRLLFCLWVAGPQRSAALAHMMWATPSTLSSITNTLEKQQLVRRERHVEDRRAVTVHLTAAGAQVATQAFGAQHERETAWLQTLTRKELEQLVRILGKLSGMGHPPRGQAMPETDRKLL